IDDVAKNNSKTVTATSAGLITTLDDEIGPVAVLPLDSAGTAVNYATAPVSITLPTTDARGLDRDSISDAGAYEYMVPPNNPPIIVQAIENQTYESGFSGDLIDISQVFTDVDSDSLTLSVVVTNESVVTAVLTSPFNLTITEIGSGETTISVTADDGNEGVVTDTFTVIVNAPVDPTVFIGQTSYPSVTAALTAAVDSDVILVRGIHTESITVNKSVTIRGVDPNVDIIQAAAASGTASDRVVNIIRPNASTILNVTIENLGIKNGNTTANGGGINVDKATGLVLLKNLRVLDNNTTTNGGALNVLGSNLDIIDCTIQNNTSTLDGGAIVVAPSNSVGIDNNVRILSSLIDSNTGRNGGGLYINGNNSFGNDHLIDVYVENTTISNNIANSASGGSGGGAIWSKGSTWTGDNTTGNASLTLVHATLYNNTHSGATKNGIRFTSAPTGSLTNFQLYNSVVVTGDDVSEKALNLTNSNTTDVVNSILGGLEGASSFLSIIDDAAKNNSKSVTATVAGLITTLDDEIGPVAVLPLDSAGTAVNYATAPVSITLPTTDARGVNRDAAPDAGAYEIGIFVNDRVFIDEVGYPNITSALTAAVDGDVILVTGIHTESITIDKSVTLRGVDPNVDIIQAAESSGTASDRVVNVVRPDDNPVLTVTIENLGIRNGNAT
ncbi:MAG: choice-of-anchor Q domain-containing protein, partial [Bacteroidota bacterium]